MALFIAAPFAHSLIVTIVTILMLRLEIAGHLYRNAGEYFNDELKLRDRLLTNQV